MYKDAAAIYIYIYIYIYHGRSKEKSRVPRVCMDFMFLTERGFTQDKEEAEKATECIAILVLKDEMHESVWAYPMEAKSIVKADWLIAQIIDDMKTCGLDKSHIVAKSDNEAAIVEIQEELARQRAIAGAEGTAIENSRVGDSSSNGRVERAIQEVGNMIMTLKVATVENLGLDKLRLEHPLVPWLVKHAAAQITKFQIRQCGRTSFEQIKGRTCAEPMAEIGECVMFRPPKTNVEKRWKNNFVEPYIHGIFMGTEIRSGEPLVGTADGVYTAGQVRRVADDERWSQAAVNNFKGCPHEPVPGKGRTAPSFVRPELRGGDTLPPAPTTGFTKAEAKDQKTRPLYVRKEDISTHGPTRNCRGCLTVVQGRPYSKPHTEECRSRFAEILADTEAGRRRVARTENRLQDAVVREFENIMDKKNNDDDAKKRKIDLDHGGAKPSSSSAAIAGDNSTNTAAIKTDEEARRKLEFDTTMDEDLDKAPASVRAAILGKGSSDIAVEDQEMEGRGEKRRSETTMAEIDPQSDTGFLRRAARSWCTMHRLEATTQTWNRWVQ